MITLEDARRIIAAAEKKATEITPDNFAFWIQRYGVGDRETFDRFLASGVDVNADTGSLGRPLHVAIFGGNYSLLPRLLKAGADPRLGDKNGNTPLHLLASQVWIVTTPEERRAAADPTIKLLTAAGADVSAPANDGSTPLHAAVKAKNREMIEALLANKANINAECRDNLDKFDGVTPLQLAIDMNDKSTEEYLRSKGATVNRSFQAKRAMANATRALIAPLFSGMH